MRCSLSWMAVSASACLRSALMSNLCLVLMVKGDEWNSRALRFALGVAWKLVSFLGGWAGAALADGSPKRSGRSSSSELKSSSSSSSEPRMTALRSRAADAGTGDDEKRAKIGDGDGDGGGGVGFIEACVEVGVSRNLEPWGLGLCDGLGTGLKKLVMLLFFDISGRGSVHHHLLWKHR